MQARSPSTTSSTRCWEAWPDLTSAAGAKAPVGGAQAEGLHHHHHHHHQQLFGGGPYDESALLAWRLRQHQINGGGVCGGGGEADGAAAAARCEAGPPHAAPGHGPLGGRRRGRRRAPPALPQQRPIGPRRAGAAQGRRKFRRRRGRWRLRRRLHRIATAAAATTFPAASTAVTGAGLRWRRRWCVATAGRGSASSMLGAGFTERCTLQPCFTSPNFNALQICDLPSNMFFHSHFISIGT